MNEKGKFWQDTEKDWKFYFDEGKSYLATCKKLIQKKGCFDNEFIYNLSVLAGERLALGLLLSYNHIPSATSLSGILQEGKGFYELDTELLNGARFINKFQFFCSLEVVPLTVPNDEELTQIVNYINTLEEFCTSKLNNEVVA